MENTKIIHFLKCLSKQELREFGKFVRSPFHNNRKDVIRFYDIIKEYFPDFNIDDPVKKNIYKELYPGKKYNPDAIVLLNSYLYNLGRDYLAVSGLKNDKFFYKYHFLKNLDEHNADNLFEKEHKYTVDFLDNENLNKKFFLRKSMLEDLKINFNLKRNRQDKIYQNSIDYGNYSVYSFIIEMAILYHDMLVDKKSFNYEYLDSAAELFLKNFNFEEFMTKHIIKKNEYNNYIAYYYWLFMCNYYPENEHHYVKLKEYSFLENPEELSIVEKSTRLHYMIDYCLMQAKAGNSKFMHEAFDLYKIVLEEKLYQADSKDANIGLIFFRNFVTIGLAAGEYDYVEKFIYEHGREIKGDTRDDLLELSYAMLHYEKNEYTKALECLNKVSNTFPLFRLATKHLLVKIYYETDQYDPFFSLVDTYKHYLKNEKIITDLIRSYHTNFLHYLSILIKIKSSDNNDNLFILKKEIEENMNMDPRHKQWLTEKAGKLNGKHD